MPTGHCVRRILSARLASDTHESTIYALARILHDLVSSD